jgi:hypothetical protein
MADRAWALPAMRGAEARLSMAASNVGLDTGKLALATLEEIAVISHRSPAPGLELSDPKTTERMAWS